MTVGLIAHGRTRAHRTCANFIPRDTSATQPVPSNGASSLLSACTLMDRAWTTTVSRDLVVFTSPSGHSANRCC
jgi:hypothetical protein